MIITFCSLSLSIFRKQAGYLFLVLSLSDFLFLSQTLCLSVSLCLSLSFTVPTYSFNDFLTLSVSLPFRLSFPLSVSLSLCVSVCLYLRLQRLFPSKIFSTGLALVTPDPLVDEVDVVSQALAVLELLLTHITI